jgi:hypothetical protein
LGTGDRQFDSAIADHVICVHMPAKNKEAQSIAFNKWYAKNKNNSAYKASQAETKKRLRKERRKWFQDLKKTLKCNRCPETDWRVLDFHHKDPSQKDWEVANMVRSRWSQKRILAEIDKCEVLCANCHRREHWDEKHKSEVTD